MSRYGNYDRPPREMHEVTCAYCGKKQKDLSNQTEEDPSTVRTVFKNISQEDFNYIILNRVDFGVIF